MTATAQFCSTEILVSTNDGSGVLEQCAREDQSQAAHAHATAPRLHARRREDRDAARSHARAMSRTSDDIRVSFPLRPPFSSSIRPRQYPTPRRPLPHPSSPQRSSTSSGPSFLFSSGHAVAPIRASHQHQHQHQLPQPPSDDGWSVTEIIPATPLDPPTPQPQIPPVVPL